MSSFPYTCPDEPAQIDLLATQSRGWYAGDPRFPAYGIIASYMDSTLSLSATVSALADPIDHAYTNPMSEARRVELRADPNKEPWLQSTEMLLWNLWYAVLHHARRHSWRDDAAHGRLLDLMRGLKARPDPPKPEGFENWTKLEWVYEFGGVWAGPPLAMLGPTLAESFNWPVIRSPQKAAELSVAEVHAWANFCGFLAKVTGEGVVGLENRALSSMSIMMDTLAQKPAARMKNYGVGKGKQLDVDVPPAALWIIKAGEVLWGCKVESWREEKEEVRDSRNRMVTRIWRETWEKWRRAFEGIERRWDVGMEAKELAREAARRMLELQRT